MTVGTTAAFLVVCFMFLACFIRLAHLIWVAMVHEGDRYYIDREFWDEEDILTERSEDFVNMGTHVTPIEYLSREEAYEQD